MRNFGMLSFGKLSFYVGYCQKIIPNMADIHQLVIFGGRTSKHTPKFLIPIS